MGRERRNIGILAHVDAGKTTLTEQLLFLGGMTRRAGSVDQGTTVSDWMVDEQERGITITSAAATFGWKGVDVTLVDTPGHIDFTIEVERVLRVLDGVVIVISGPDGIQAQTETVWNQVALHGLPVVFFINKLDLAGTEPEMIVDEIAEKLGATAVPLQATVRTANGWEVHDLLTASVTRWEPEVAERPQTERIQARQREALLERLANAAASHDDAYAEAVLEGQDLPISRHLEALRQAVATRAAFPLVHGVARKGLGIASLADAVTLLMPAAVDSMPLLKATLVEPCAYVFKTEPRRQARLAYVRAFGGSIRSGSPLFRAGAPHALPSAPFAEVFGRDFEVIDLIEPGQIAALVFSRQNEVPRTGDTLWTTSCDRSIEAGRPPAPVLQRVIEAPDPAAHELIVDAIAEQCADDPSLRIHIEPSSGRIVLSGMGELHLEIAIERLARALGFAIRAGDPSVLERWRLLTEGRGTSRVQHPSARGQVEVVVTAIPHESFRCELPRIERDDFRKAFLSGIEQAAAVDGLDGRVLAGACFTVTGLEITGSEIVPSMLRDVAMRAAHRAIDAAGLERLEPWGHLEVVAPEVAIGRVLGDLARRRARLLGSESRGSSQSIRAEVPLSELIGYASALRSLSAGRAAFTLTPLGFLPAPVPSSAK